MKRRLQFLPGVKGPDSTPRRNRSGVAREVRHERIRATVRDVLDTLLLATIDMLFMRFPDMHLPYLGRDASLAILLLAHVIFIAYWISSRLAPTWRARKVAATWSVAEQQRFVIR